VRLQSALLVENAVPTSQDVRESVIVISVVEQKFRRKWDTEDKLRLTRGGNLLCLTRRVQKIDSALRGEVYSAL
jgi:hypothetical protein